MKQQTAVEWLLDNIKLNLPTLIGPQRYFNLLQQAKQIEKEQIINAHNSGKYILPPNENGEQYYNETYGQ